MSDIHELYRTIGQQHCRLGQSYLALADHLDYLRENPSYPPESEHTLSTVPTEARPPEMSVHVPSTVPPNNGITHYDGMPPFDHVSDTVPHAAEFAPDASWANDGPGVALSDAGIKHLTDSIQQRRTSIIPDHVHELGSCSTCDNAPSSEVRRSAVAASETPAVEHAPPPPSRTRARNEYTAAEWANGPHFLAYMAKAPFNTWTAEQQNAKRDEFTATYKDAPPQNRWGKTFAKFCGVT